MRSKNTGVFVLPSAYDVFQPDGSIEIYRGKFIIEALYQEGKEPFSRSPEVAEVEGNIFLKCNPNAIIRIKAKTFSPLDVGNMFVGNGDHRDYKVRVPGYLPADFSGSVKVSERSSYDKRVTWEGQLQRLCTAAEGLVHSIDFCLPNVRPHSFFRETRFENETHGVHPGSLQCDIEQGWTLKITPARRNSRELEVGQKIEKLGGVVITHIGRLERQDGRAFKVDNNAEKVLTALRYCISFVSERYVQPTLLVGRDQNGNVSWRKTESLIIDPYKPSDNWASMLGFSYDGDGDWSELFNCWLRAASDRRIHTALNWYLRACRSNFAEEAIVLTHIGLEALGWQKNMDDAKKWLPALLKKMNVPETEPPALTELQNFRRTELSTAKQGSYKKFLESAPLFFVGLRNHAVHSQQINMASSSKLTTQIAMNAAYLGRYYLELAMLYTLGYRGQYYNWLRNDGLWQDEPVPWV